MYGERGSVINSILYRSNNFVIRCLISDIAKLFPIQLRCPIPKAKNAEFLIDEPGIASVSLSPKAIFEITSIVYDLESVDAFMVNRLEPSMLSSQKSTIIFDCLHSSNALKTF
ncbi:hypothetical protein BLOT_015629 [Blomia tropicalis]|nr:hypothetical protein BLOT_015629 [Blomia tropicalis]